jgi:thiamine phosphate synthase YjbQ (UPF0047 family)
MKSYRKELNFHTKTRRVYVNITPQVEAALAESGISEGLCLVNAMNITAGVFINDKESDRPMIEVTGLSIVPAIFSHYNPKYCKTGLFQNV